MQAPHVDTPESPSPPRVFTLGGFTLVSSSVQSASPLLGPGKPLALLLYLHSSPSRSASREHLTDLLWADLDPVAARHALRQTLWYLRQRLGSGCIRTDNGDVALDLNITCDRDDFVRAVEEGHAEDAVDLYRGHFLPDFAVPGGLEFEHWSDAERTRLRLMFLRTAERVVRLRLSTGRARGAREVAQRIRDGNVHSEASWRLYLETLMAGHDTLGALAEAERMLTVLRQDGRTPEPATRALLRAIQQEPEPAAAPATGLVAELVGREGQFAAIVESWETVRGRRATQVHVSAPAGLGKTRLLLDVESRLTAAGGRCVYVRANPGERTVPYALAAEFAAVLSELSGAKGISPASAGALVALNPAVSSTFRQPADTASGEEAARRRALAVTELVKALADEAAIAILIDDLHWADAASRRLVDAVFGRLSAERVLVVTAARPVPGPDAPPLALRIELPPLTVDQVAALLASLGTLTGDLARDLPALVLEASGGSPLLALESLQAALDVGLLVLVADSWQSPTPQALAERLTRGSALRDRVAGLERSEHWLLVLLATGGLPLATEVLACAARRTVDAVSAELLQLERRGLVQRAPDGWEPAHDAIAEAVTAAASADALHTASATLGRALAREAHAPQQLVARAAQLLARSDGSALTDLFRRWVRSRRRMGDRRRPASLAIDLVGADATERVHALARSLPLHVRLGIDTPGRVVALAIPLLVLGIAAQIVLARPRTPPPDAELLAISNDQNSPGTWRAELRRNAWDPRFDVELHRTRHTLASVLSEARAGSAIAPALDGRSWIVEHVFTDSGGMDLVQVFTDGRASRRLTSARGDDGAASEASWAPDGSALAFTTARWSELSRYDVAVLDMRDGTVRQVTSSDAADGYPRWSRDGARIAFGRKFFDSRMPAVCTVGVDGTDLRCRDIASDIPPMVLGWTDDRRIVLQRDSAGVSLWEVMDAISGTRTRLGASVGGRGHLSPDGGWVLVHGPVPGSSEPSWRVFPVDRPAAARTLSGDIPQGARILWGQPPTPPPYLTALSVEPSAEPIPVRATYRLYASGVSSAGARLPLHFVHWQSSDTAIATIDSAGVVRPLKSGRVTVVASAGGWRADTLEVEIGSGDATFVLTESWAGGLDTSWVPWGVPLPVVERLSDGRDALLTRGDSSYDSGVYSRITVPAIAGIGLEAAVAGVLSAQQWQRHVLAFYGDLDSTWLAGWDHRTGGLDTPRYDSSAERCWAAYPAQEGTTGPERLRFGCATEALTVPAPIGMRDGSWHVLRLQVFPDGRLGIAVDGVPLGITSAALRLDSRYRAVILGQSHRARMLVGDVTMWTGVRDDIDWRNAP